MSEVKDLGLFEEGAPGDPGRDPRGAGADEPEVEIVSFGDDDEEAAGGGAGDGSGNAAAAELAELRERHLRLRADFDNFRKRVERERDERMRRGIAETMRDLLPVADNLERALSANGSLDDLRLGVEMIARQLADVLRRQGVEAVPALGAPFDPQLHEAVAREEGAEVAVPTVVAELQRGYLHGDRLLRPAMVRVAMPAAATSAAAKSTAGKSTAGDREPGPEDAS
jgi:molecular chaperone GrpE